MAPEETVSCLTFFFLFFFERPFYDSFVAFLPSQNNGWPSLYHECTVSRYSFPIVPCFFVAFYHVHYTDSTALKEDKASIFGDSIDINTFDQILEMDDPGDNEFSHSIVFGFFTQAEETFIKMDTAMYVNFSFSWLQLKPSPGERNQQSISSSSSSSSSCQILEIL